MSQSGPQSQPDLELVERALRGEADAVEEFIERLQCIPRILETRNRLHGLPLGPDEIDDLVQETLAAVWRRLDSYQGKSSLESWVYGFCTRVMSTAYRTRRRQPGLVELHESVAPDPSMAAAAFEEHESVSVCLENVPPAQRDVILFKHFEQLTFDEIARRLEMSSNTVKSNYYRGLDRLRELLARTCKESFA